MTLLSIAGFIILLLASLYTTVFLYMLSAYVPWRGWSKKEIMYFAIIPAVLWALLFWVNPFTISIGVG